ncbi:MAG TPA: NAD(P)H-hydrate dehydratase [Allosphingosinicella sp.]
MEDLTRSWLGAHPLPDHSDGTEKDARGRLLVIGGSRFVPGALRLTGEAALRAGCGRLRLATVEEVAIPLGTLIPEAAMIALPEDERGEIHPGRAAERLLPSLNHCDCVLFGPGMTDPKRASPLLEWLLREAPDDLPLILDAAAIAALGGQRTSCPRGPLVLTPHHGEFERLTQQAADAIAADPARAALEAARGLQAVVVLKSAETVIAEPGGRILRYSGGGIGLATGGSGDILSGILGGLIARSLACFEAAAWAVWLHGEAGRLLAEKVAPIGFLARELLPEIPRLMADG